MKINQITSFFESLFNPYCVSFILMLFSIIWLCWRGDGLLVRAGLLISLFGFFLFSTGWIPAIVTDKLEGQYPIVEKPNPEIKWIVVLGGGHQEMKQQLIPANDLLSHASIERLVEGVRLYRQIPNAKLLLSGGSSAQKEKTEAFYLENLAIWFGVPKKDIVLEHYSNNTADEAVAIKKMLQNQPFYLVTSAVHMPRAMALCKYQGLSPLAAPTGLTFYWETGKWHKFILPHHTNLSHTSAAWHEILGLIWGRLNGLL